MIRMNPIKITEILYYRMPQGSDNARSIEKTRLTPIKHTIGARCFSIILFLATWRGMRMSIIADPKAVSITLLVGLFPE